MTESKVQIIQKAEFNPRLKTYLLVANILFTILLLVTIPLLPLVLIIAPIIIRKQFDRLECELTTRSLRFKKGYIFQTERTIPLDKIQDLTFKEGPLLKYFGLSILKIETAGNSVQQGMSDLSLIGIIDAAAFRNKVLDQRDLVTDNKLSTQSEGTDSAQVLIEIRDSLRRIEEVIGKK